MGWSWKHWALAATSGFGLLWLLRRRAVAAVAKPPESFTPCTLLYDGGEYATTWGDWLWMARACSGESRYLVGQEAVAWCLLQRKAARAQRGKSETLTGLIRGFSQPVNPIWSAYDACSLDGRGCCGSTIEACTPERIAHRLAVQSRTWGWFEQNAPELYRSILLLAEGRYPPRNPVVGYTNFAMCGSFDDSGALDVGGNCYIKEPTLHGKISLRPGG